MDLFIKAANDIFIEAGVEKKEAPELYIEIVDILSEKMAILSATMGMSFKRVDAFNEQRVSLINDLKELKSVGGLR